MNHRCADLADCLALSVLFFLLLQASGKVEASTIKRLHSLSSEVTRLKGKLKVLQVSQTFLCCCCCCCCCLLKTTTPSLPPTQPRRIHKSTVVRPNPAWREQRLLTSSLETPFPRKRSGRTSCCENISSPRLPLNPPPPTHTRIPYRTRTPACPSFPPPAHKRIYPGRKRHPCGDPPFPPPTRQGAKNVISYLPTPSRARLFSAVGGCRPGGGGGEG